MNCADWKEPVSEGNILYYSIHINCLKLQNYRSGQQISGCQRLRKGWRRERGGRGSKRARGARCGGGRALSVSWLCHCHNPSCVSIPVPQFHKTLLLADAGERVHNLSITSYSCMLPQLSQNKKKINLKKNKEVISQKIPNKIKSSWLLEGDIKGGEG